MARPVKPRMEMSVVIRKTLACPRSSQDHGSGRTGFGAFATTLCVSVGRWRGDSAALATELVIRRDGRVLRGSTASPTGGRDRRPGDPVVRLARRHRPVIIRLTSQLVGGG